MRRGLAWASACALLTASAPTAAGDPPRHPNDRLGYDLRIDIPLTASLLLAGVVLQAADLEPDTCGWCEGGAGDTEAVNGLDRWTRDTLRWSEPRVAQRMSDITGYAMVPVIGVAGGGVVAWADDRADEILINVLIAVEASALSGLVTQGVKLAVGRERPGYHALPASARAGGDPETTSYWSGHSSLAFSFATASATVASLRGYRNAWVLWATGLAFASATAYLRVAGDRHYLTDTLSGAASGAAIGVAVPLLHHVRGHQPAPQRGRLHLVPVGFGIGVSGQL